MFKRAFKTDLVFELVVTRWSQSCRTESDQISRSESSVLTVGDRISLSQVSLPVTVPFVCTFPAACTYVTQFQTV